MNRNVSSLFRYLSFYLFFLFLYITLTRAQSDDENNEVLPQPQPQPFRLVRPRPRNRAGIPRLPRNSGPDSRAQIRCIGYPFESKALDSRGSSLRAYFDLPSRQLCAKTWYGGNPDFNVGGYCRHDIEGAHGGPLVVFDQEPWTNENHDITASDGKLALYTYCQFQCRCVQNPLERVGNSVFPAQEIFEYENINRQVWDQNPITTTDVMGETDEPYTQQIFLVIPETATPEQWGEALYFKGDQLYSSPRCRNVLPDWSLPSPFENRPSDWRLLDLCASVLTGGSRKGNAGGVCLNSEGDKAEISFEDYLTQ